MPVWLYDGFEEILLINNFITTDIYYISKGILSYYLVLNQYNM